LGSRKQPQQPSSDGAAPGRRSPLSLIAAFLAGAAVAGLIAVAARPDPAPPAPAAAPALPPTARAQTSPSFDGKAGPWGVFEYTPIQIAPPADLIKVDGEIVPSRWFFRGLARRDVEQLFQQVGLDGAQLQTLARSPWKIAEAGVAVTPPPELILGLQPPARSALYAVLARNPENVHNSALAFEPDDLERRLAASKLAPATVDLFRRLLYRQGDMVFFADDRTLLPMITDAEERTRLILMLARQQTYAVRLKLNERSDLPQLLQYWGTPGRTKDIEPVLRSLVTVPGGYALDLAHLLPPIARRRIFTYPRPGKQGDETKNCHWTSLNFHRDPPIDQFADPAQAAKEVAAHYVPVTAPAFGDLVVLADKDSGAVVHSAVYLADDLVFTKNGFGLAEPWMYMPLDRMMKIYSLHLGQPDSVKVLLYRRRGVHT
jgi:hypothetical protein